MTAPIRLRALTFAHQPQHPATSGILLRRNAVRSVLVPEWRPGSCVTGSDTPVGYAVERLDQPVVQIQLSRTDATARGGRLRAIDPLAAAAESLRSARGNLLGDLPAVPVRLDSDAPITVTAPIDPSLLRAGGVQARDGVWLWQWQPDGETGWIDVTETAIRVYALLDLPTLPWSHGSDPADTQLPWTEVLDYACQWAAGSRTSQAAATAITEAVYGLGPDLFEYGCPILAQTQYSTPTFDCTAFLDRLHGGTGNGRYVNCTDCATIVSSLTNVVGGDLWQSTMWTLNDQGVLDWFGTNELRPIGVPDWQLPCGWLGFYYHEVAWSGDCEIGDQVYDACVAMDATPEPAGIERQPGLQPAPRQGWVPTGLPFGQPGEGLYRDRLAAPSGRSNCAPQPHTRQRRRVT